MKAIIILRRSLLFALVACLPGLTPVYAQMSAGDLTVDVRNGDQQGKLMLRGTELAFESLTDGKHSKSWKYSEIRSLEKKRKEVRVKPYKGARYDFQFPDNGARDRIYDAVSARILTARSQTKK